MKIKHIVGILTAVSLLYACSDDDNKCMPACSGMQCGPDGCGGSCGECGWGSVCRDGACVPNSELCTPDCTQKQCGSDGCGGSCGECPADAICNSSGLCIQNSCTPDCTGKQCGGDGCGGSCGECPVDTVCNANNGKCVPKGTCIPNCTGKQCGDDGCGGVCGSCPADTVCNANNGKCVPKGTCIPNCTGKQCGDDGCGGVCGSCPVNTVCNANNGKCVPKGTCIPNCTGKQCGSDGCGGSCGACPADTVCSTNTGKCIPKEICTPDCTRKQCGSDGCGGSCGSCSNGLTCDTEKGRCICIPFCADRVCGNDGCGGSCGSCPKNSDCNEATGTCMDYSVSGKLILEKLDVSFDERSTLPKLDQSVDIAGSDIPIALFDAAGNVLGETTTDKNGEFHFEMTRIPHADDFLTIVPAWFVGNEPKLAVFVANTTGAIPYDLWAWEIKLKNYGSRQDFTKLKDIRISVDDNSGALYIYQTLVQAYKDLASHGYGKTLENLPSMGVLWKPGLVFPCGSCFMDMITSGLEVGNHTMQKTMLISAAQKDESAWGYPTLLHEFGHYTLFQIKDSSKGGMHYINGLTNPPLAWSEGYATFYSLMAMSWQANAPVTKYWRVFRTGNYWLDYAHLFDETDFGSLKPLKPNPDSPDGMKQDLCEAWISHVMWEIFDGKDIPEATSPGDGIAIGTQGIFDAIRSNRYKNYGSYNYHNDLGNTSARTEYGVDFVDFIDAVICNSDAAGNNDEAEAIIDFVIEKNFPYDRSPVCITKDERNAI